MDDNSETKYLIFLKLIMETKNISDIFWFTHFKGTLFSNFASKLFASLIR